MSKKRKIDSTADKNSSNLSSKVEPKPDLIMKISDIELIISKMKSLGVTEFKIETSERLSLEKEIDNVHIQFKFFSRDYISYFLYRDNCSGFVDITYSIGPDIQEQEDLLKEKRALMKYIDDESEYWG